VDRVGNLPGAEVQRQVSVDVLARVESINRAQVVIADRLSSVTLAGRVACVVGGVFCLCSMPSCPVGRR
jgi:hypothetical protein